MNRPKTKIASVVKAFNVLSEVARRPTGATAKEVAAALEMPVPTTHHLLNTLSDISALTKGSDRRYQLGPRIGGLSGAYYDQAEPAEPLLVSMRQLAESTGETAYLTAWRGADIEVLASAEGHHAVRVAGLSRGSHGSAHARASGKLLLALAAPALRERYLAGNEIAQLTESTITESGALERELEQIAERGFSIDDEEYSKGVSCVAAPIIFDGLVVGAYTVSAPTERFQETREQLIDAVKSAAGNAVSGQEEGTDGSRA